MAVWQTIWSAFLQNSASIGSGGAVALIVDEAIVDVKVLFAVTVNGDVITVVALLVEGATVVVVAAGLPVVLLIAVDRVDIVLVVDCVVAMEYKSK